MNRFKTMTMLSILTLVLVAASASADALIQARSDVPARVFVDGRPVGVTPVDVVVAQRGQHEIRFRAFGSRRDRTFVVQVPGRRQIVTPLFARLGFGRGHGRDHDRYGRRGGFGGGFGGGYANVDGGGFWR